MREQLESVVAQTKGRVTPHLLQREFDLSVELVNFMWVWEDYRDATAGRKNGMDGPDLLTHQKLVFWQWSRRIRIPDWQTTVMLKIDEAYIREMMTPAAEGDKKESET